MLSLMAGIYIPGLTVDSNGGGLQPGQSISFGVQPANGPAQYGSPLPITGNVQGANTSNTSSSGGGSSRPTQTSQPSQPSQSSQPQQPDISSQVNSAYNDAYGALNDWQNQLQGNYNNFVQSYTAPFDALVPQAQQAYQAGMNLNQQQVADNNTQSANAIAAARALYNQVNQGATQRFGGSTGVGTGVSSAADFANAFYNQALGQNQSQIYNTQSQNANNLAGQANTINSQYQNQLQQISSQKAAASDQAQQIFQQEMQQIASQKTQLGVDKAQQQLQALQNYQNNLNSIQAQANQLASNLQLQNNAAALGLTNSLGAYNTFATTPYATAGYGTPQYATPGAAPTTNSNGMFISGSVGNPNQIQPSYGQVSPGQINYGQQVY